MISIVILLSEDDDLVAQVDLDAGAVRSAPHDMKTPLSRGIDLGAARLELRGVR